MMHMNIYVHPLDSTISVVDRYHTIIPYHVPRYYDVNNDNDKTCLFINVEWLMAFVVVMTRQPVWNIQPLFLFHNCTTTVGFIMGGGG